MNRRDFLRASTWTPALAVGSARAASPRPNFLLLIADQLSIDAIAAHGNRYVRTPNLDRLVRAGVSFRESYSAYPLCSPGRSSIFTGRMPSENGVVTNGLKIRSEIPNLGQWLGAHGYETVYGGKWHLSSDYPAEMPGFKVLPGGYAVHGHFGDPVIARACQAWLYNWPDEKPFFMVASLLQPHDINTWIDSHNHKGEWEKQVTSDLPPLPANFQYDLREPAILAAKYRPLMPHWSEQQWRYYLWSYYRHVETVDAEFGRILDALEDAGHAKNTVVILTADHGEGCAHHQTVTKNYLYDEAAKVPLLLSWPGEMPAGRQDTTHLVSGIDIVPTICDYAGVPAPEMTTARSLKPLARGQNVQWRPVLVAECNGEGRMVRTRDYKYVMYPNDPVEQLFDWRSDAQEMHNMAGEPKYAAALQEHRKLLKEWEGQLKTAPPSARHQPGA